MRLLEINDVPRPVGNSLDQGMVFNLGQARTHSKLSYHSRERKGDILGEERGHSGYRQLSWDFQRRAA